MSKNIDTNNNINQEGKSMNKKTKANAKQKLEDIKSRLHLPPTRDEIHARLMILNEDHNARLLSQVAYSVCKRASWRDDVMQDVIMTLAEAPTLSIEAEAVGLLATPDGSPGRGRAHAICTNLARNASRRYLKIAQAEASTDFQHVGFTQTTKRTQVSTLTETQQDAVTAAYLHDGRWKRTDKDVARDRINAMHQFAFYMESAAATRMGTNVEGRPIMEFRRGAEKIKEITVGGREYNAKGIIMLAKEQSLANMLSHAMRIGDLHDFGRSDRVDALTLSQWHRAFTNMEPPTATKFGKKVYSLSAGVLGSDKYRHAAVLMFFLAGVGVSRPINQDGAAIMAIGAGQVRSIGTLVEACTNVTQGRTRKDREGAEVTDEYMLVGWSLCCQLLGLDPTSSNRKSLDKLVMTMAMEAGASKFDRKKVGCSTLERFPESWYTPVRQRKHNQVLTITKMPRRSGTGDTIVAQWFTTDTYLPAWGLMGLLSGARTITATDLG